MKNWITSVLAIALISVSCSESKKLQNSLKNYKLPIAYMHDSNRAMCTKTDSLVLILNKVPIDLETKVKKNDGFAFPLLIFNYSEVNMNVVLGQSSIIQDYTDFFYNSFRGETKRSGCFSLSENNSNDSTYRLEITVDTCKTQSIYQRSTTVLFLVLAYSVSNHEKAFHASTSLNVNATLKKGNNIVWQKSYFINRLQPFENSGYENFDQLKANFLTNMIASLALGTKECTEEIITDLNSFMLKK